MELSFNSKREKKHICVCVLCGTIQHTATRTHTHTHKKKQLAKNIKKEGTRKIEGKEPLCLVL
jgi:hypothetical protein